MLVSPKTETVGINIFLDKQEAMILSYILSAYDLDYITKKNIIQMEMPVKAHFMCMDLLKQIKEVGGR